MKKLCWIFGLLFLSFLSNAQVRITTNNGLMNNKVHCFFIDDNNTLWLGTSRGISQVNNWNTSPEVISRSTSVPVVGLADFEGDFIWAATDSKGIYKYHTRTREMLGFRHDLFRGKDLKSLKFTDQKLFVESNEGWNQFDLSNEQLTNIERKKSEILLKPFKFQGVQYDAKDGLLVDNIIASFPLDENEIVLSTNGIDAFNTKYKTIQSLIKKKWTINAYEWINEQLILATNNGVYIFGAKDFEFKEKQPSIQLQDWKLNGETQTENNADLSFEKYEFEFNIDTKKFPNASSFFYKIDEDWKPIDSPIFSIEGLSHGDYNIQFKACNKGGYCVELEVLNLHIDHPLKKDWIKYAFFILMAVIYTAVVVILTRKKYQQQITILEEAVIEKQNKINKIEGKY